MNKLFLQIKMLKSDNGEFQEIFKHFEKTINIFTRKYNIYDNYNDILYHLWYTLKKVDLSNFNTQNDLERYISRTLKRYCLDICNKRKIDKKIMYNSEIVDKKLSLIANSYSSYLEFEFNDLISILPDDQKKIIYMKFVEDIKEIDIAKKLNISRQSVYKNKILALERLEPILKKLINM
ncbi:TPA: botulinum neurotoxin transcription-activating sigma factor BotR [Clostridium botulinum]|uniref:botulinum neurotoxin transcription-activating sigma factor BotR n=1 Tax=Clostridium sporogenes TaxID=1509 RepID=UPI000773F1D3|nr:botulinum neurotoxin transcription-activating sigma factor BotR [Clostridium sporogenes]AUM93822.1 transcriptional regulator BotR, P-21 [Clostridium sporogenes]HBJ2612735.1 botulinum neurotoxin transcription-activating sigma factor BotR [Clostridium botulinum]